MEAQIAGEKVVGLWTRVRVAIGNSAWGSLAGKSALYIAGFALLAVVGSGRIHCLAAPAHDKQPSAVAAPPASAAPAEAPSRQAAMPPEAYRSDAGAETDAGDANVPADAGAGEGGLRPDGKVVLNNATEEDLRHLPGIGATRAKAILALRAKLGRFGRVEDLLRVKGIGRRSLLRLRPLVVLD